MSDIQIYGYLFLNSIWSEEILDIVFYSAQNPLQCSFHILSILYANGNRLGRRAAVLHRRLQESHGFLEMQVLQEKYPKVEVWAWCLKEGSYHWIRSHSISLSIIGNSWIFQLLSSAQTQFWHFYLQISSHYLQIWLPWFLYRYLLIFAAV